MHGAAKVRFPPFTPWAQHQHSRRQLRLRLRTGGHARAYGECVESLNILGIFKKCKHLSDRAPFDNWSAHFVESHEKFRIEFADFLVA